MPTLPAAGVLLYRLRAPAGSSRGERTAGGAPFGGADEVIAAAPSGGGEVAAPLSGGGEAAVATPSGGDATIEVLLFPRGAASGASSTGKLLEIPCWELPPTEPAGPASRAGLPYEPRRREKPRLSARRTMDRLLEQACTSFAALTGLEPPPPYLALGGVKMRGHRIVYVWGCACPPDETPAGPGRFVPLDQAHAVIEPQQRRFLEQLTVLVAPHEVE